MVTKEFLQLRRDRITFGMIVGIPIVQLTLFGFAINTDPKHMPTALIIADQSEFTRTFVQAMTTSEYFRIIGELPDQEAGRAALAQGRAQFVVTIPADFTTKLLRGERPSILPRGRRLGPYRDQRRTRGVVAALSRWSRARTSPGRCNRCAVSPRRSRSRSSASTTRSRSRSTTSCRDSWA